MTDTEPRYEPPAHQTATFDQTYAEISAMVDELVTTYRNVRAQNAATREVDIAGIEGFLMETPITREQFIGLYTVAVVRLAEHERQVS